MNTGPVIPGWMELLGWVLVHFLWQGAVIGLVTWLTLALMRRASSSSRYLLLCSALLACGLAPVATWIVLEAPAPLHGGAFEKPVPFSAPSAEASPIAPSSPSSILLAIPVAAPALPQISRLESFARAIGTALPSLVALWSLGVALLSLRLAYGWIQVRRLRASGFPLEDPQWCTRLDDLARRLHLRQTVRLLESAWVEVPAVIGWLRPVILVPAAFFSGLPSGQIEAILAHELAHIRRHDYLVNLFQVALETLLFYHPVVWWISRAIRQEREHCCDDLALHLIGDKATYALALASLEESRSLPTRLTLAASGGSLLQRIRRIAETDRRRVSSGPVFLGIIFVLISIGALAWQTTLHAQGKPKVDPEAGSNRSVTVTCLDPAGKPVAGAEVYLLERYRDVAAGKPGYNAGPTKTDGSGRVVFDHLDHDRPLWKRLLYARVPGKFVGIDCDEMRENVAAKPGDIPVQIQLLPTVTLDGKVQVPDGFLVTEVKVSIIDWMFGPDFKTAETFSGDSRDFGGIPGLRHLLEFQPDAEGHVAISDLPIGCYIYLSGTSPRLGESQFMAIELKPKPEPFLLILDHEGSIEGTVRDSQGKGLGGVEISCRPSPRPMMYVLRSFDSVTEATGHFRVPGLPASRFEVQLSNLPDGLTCQPRNEVIVQSGKTEPLDFVISPGIELSGEVRDKQTGKGIPGVELGFLGGDNPLNGNPYAYAKTNGEGRFKVLLPPGESTCSFSNYPKNYVPPGQAGNQLFNLQAGQIPAPLLLELTSKPADAPKLSPYDAEPAVAHGRVLDLSGQPLANIEVSSNYRPKKTETYSQGHGHTVTGKDGTYTLSLLPYGTNHMIIGGVTTSSIESKDFETLPGSQHQIDDLTVRPGTATISGRVIDENGKPVANAEVTAGSEHKHPQGVGVKTDLEGKFTVDHLLDDEEVFVSASGPDYYYGTARAKPSSRDVEVTLMPTPSMSATTKPRAGTPVAPDAKTTSTSEKDMTIPTRNLIVHVISTDGKPVAGATVKPMGLRTKEEPGSFYFGMLTNGKPISPPATTDVSGNATIAYPVHIMDDLTTGTVAVQVQHPDACSISEELEVDAPKPVTLVRGMKVTLSALPVAGVSFSRVEAQIADPERKSDSPKWEHLPDGSVSTHLPHGEYLVRLIAATAEGKVYFSSSVPHSVPLGYSNVPDSNMERGGSFRQVEGYRVPGTNPSNVLPLMPPAYSDFMTVGDGHSGRKILLPVKEGSVLHGQIDPVVPRPIKGGWVIAEVTSPDLASAYGSRALSWQGSADIAEDGSFTIPNLPLGMGTLQVIAGCDGYLSANPNQESAQSGVQEGRVIEDWSKPIILPMEKTGSARITVLAPDGKPLPGAAVAFNPNQSLGGGTNIVGNRHNSFEFLLRDKDGEVPWKPQAEKFNVKTDAQGTAVVTGLPLGSQSLMVVSESFDLPIEVRKFPSIPNAIDQPRRRKTIQITADVEASVTVTMEAKGSTSLSKAIRRVER